MNKLLTFLLLLLIVYPNQVQADMFAGYDAFCGLPVVVGYDPQTATARKDQFGQKYIHIDPSAMSNWTNSRIFVLAHECAHHLLGHTDPLGELERFSGGTAKQELEADCWAAKSLREIGLIFDINRTILQNVARGHFSINGYPSGSQRANNILECIGERKCRTIQIECQHPAHPNGDRVSCSHIVPVHPNGDIVPCQHPCYGPYGLVPCHPAGDIISCQHPVAAHPFDVLLCSHPAHPNGHFEQICD